MSTMKPKIEKCEYFDKDGISSKNPNQKTLFLKPLSKNNLCSQFSGIHFSAFCVVRRLIVCVKCTIFLLSLQLLLLLLLHDAIINPSVCLLVEPMQSCINPS